MGQPLDALLGFLSLYYLSDFNYPHQCEAGLTVLHYFIFCDRTIPGNMLQSVNGISQDCNMFKTGESRDLLIILLVNC